MYRFFPFLMPFILLLAFSVAAEEQQITIATLDFPPYVSESLPNKGWAWEVADAAFRNQGYRAQLKIYPWARALMLAKYGKVEGLFLANRTLLFLNATGTPSTTLNRRSSSKGFIWPFQKQW